MATGETGFSDVIFDLVSVQHQFNTTRSKGAHGYGQFVREARNAGYDEVATFFEQVMKEDSKRAAKCHAFMRELSGKEDVAQAADADAGRSRPSPPSDLLAGPAATLSAHQRDQVLTVRVVYTLRR